MEKNYLSVVLAWLIPGAGYILLGRWLRGLLVFASVIVLTFLGVALGGLYYPGNPAEFGVMYYLHQLAGFGHGVFAFLTFFFKEGIGSPAAADAFRSAYFEYGGRCLALAGLLNYLAILDVFDISLRRKS